MEDKRIEQLFADYLRGALSEPDAKELKSVLDASPEASRTLADQLLADRLLHEAGRKPVDADRVLELVQGSGDPAFADRLLERIMTESGARKRSTRPVRKASAGGGRRRHVVPVAVAAGLLLGIVLLLVWSRSESPRRDREKTAAGRKDPAAPIQKPQPQAPEHPPRLPEGEKKAAPPTPERDLQKKADEAFEEAIRKRKEEAPAPRPKGGEEPVKPVAPEPPPETRPEEKPVEPAPAKPTTQVMVARLERVEGKVHIVGASGRTAAKSGDPVLQGQGLEAAGPGSFALLVYPDKSRLEAGPETQLQDLKVQGGKRVHVARGEIRVVAARQTKGEEMIFSFRDGEAAVLGTTLRIAVDADPAKGTRLDVDEGKVRLKNLAAKAVTVEGGHYAVAAAGLALVSRVGDNILIDPGFEAGGKAWQVVADAGRVTVAATRTRWGTKALQLALDPQTYCRAIQDVAVVPGGSYDVSGWAWSELVGAASVSVLWLNASGGRLGAEVPVALTQNPGAWTRYSGRIVAPPGGVRLRLELRSNLMAGTAWFDDCEVSSVER